MVVVAVVIVICLLWLQHECGIEFCMGTKFRPSLRFVPTVSSPPRTCKHRCHPCPRPRKFIAANHYNVHHSSIPLIVIVTVHWSKFKMFAIVASDSGRLALTHSWSAVLALLATGLESGLVECHDS